jgi:hypothetical protein
MDPRARELIHEREMQKLEEEDGFSAMGFQ